MKHMGKITGLALSAVAALSMTAPAFASGYSFSTKAPQDYYGSTSYEDVFGSQYNYGGSNVVDYDIPELEYGRFSTTQTGVMERAVLPGLQQTVAATDGSGGYGIGGSSGPITELVEDTGTGTGPGSTGTFLPDTTQVTVPAYTSVEGMYYADGSIGTLNIPKLGISVKVWEGETTDSMAKGVGHFSSTSAWDGNVGTCGHNRGAAYNIGTVKDLVAGDIITYTTVYGTRTYQVTEVKIIANTDWSYLQATADNRITIITCLADHPESRICVQAIEVK